MREAFSVFYILLLHVVVMTFRGVGNVFEGAGGILYAHWRQVAKRHDDKYAGVEDDDDDDGEAKKLGGPKLKSVN